MTNKVKKPLTTRNGGFGGANQPLTAKNASDRWSNSKMTANTTGTTEKKNKTIEMYERALSGPPSKEWQEKKRKEESRKAAQEAAARGLTGRGSR